MCLDICLISHNILYGLMTGSCSTAISLLQPINICMVSYILQYVKPIF